MNSTGSQKTASPLYLYLGAGCALLSVISILSLRTLVTSPQTLFLVVASIVSLLPLLRNPKPETAEFFYQQGFQKTLIPLWISWGLVAAVSYLGEAKHISGGIDWFYYLCYSRDAIHFSGTADNMYSYFPGVYQFWKTAMRLVGTDITSLQNVIVIALGLNAALVGVVVFQHTRCKLVSSGAALWALVVLIRFDGLRGESEIVASLFFLSTMIAWKGTPLDHWNKWKLLFVFSLGLGLTVYMKQQAGLLAVGALALVWEQLSPRSGNRHHWGMLASLPILAALLLVGFILMEGRGLEPLSLGLSTAVAYPSYDSWWYNLYVQFRHDESFWIVVMVTMVMFIRQQKQLAVGSTPTHTPTARLVGFLLLSGFVTLVQFKIRPYHHYLLLTIPAFTISAAIIWHEHRYLLERGIKQRILMVFLAALPFCWAEDYQWAYHPAQFPTETQVAGQANWHQQGRAEKVITELKRNIPSAARLMILPSRHNSIHYLADTRSSSPHGYSFNEGAYYGNEAWLPMLETTASKYVLLLEENVRDEFDRKIWDARRIGQAQRILELRGYQRVEGAEEIELYVRAKVDTQGQQRR
jgi:hypothetical protein